MGGERENNGGDEPNWGTKPDLKAEIDSNIVVDFISNSLEWSYCSEKSHKETAELNNIIEQMGLREIWRTFHQTAPYNLLR
jgi:hypothetical protein